MLDRPLPTGGDGARRCTIGGTRYLLVEFPRMVALDTVTIALSRVLETGLLPLLAHPERYTCCSAEAVALWRELGARTQVDATTLLSPQSRGQRARALVAAGQADILAADNHGDERSIATGRRFLEAQDGAGAAELLTTLNPRAILDDAPLTQVPPVEIRRSWMQRIRQLLEGGE
jgi:protein-tyrosine phosphatase